jgi:hypothetical protein
VQRTSSRVAGAFEKQIDTSALGDGVYMLQLSTASGNTLGHLQFVVQH